MKKAVLDLETYFDSECSVRTLGVRAYIEHYNFDAYLMSVAIDDGYEWVGNPKEFDWERLDGLNIWAANAAFDETIIDVGVDKGWWRGPKNAVWDCVLDLSRRLGLPGNLAGAVEQVLGIKMDKSTRDKMKGKQWGTMDEEFRKEVEEYALKDSVLALKLVKELSGKWSDFERRISRHTRKVVRRGLPVDEEAISAGIATLKSQRAKLEAAIPWSAEATPLSRKAFNEQCRKQGIKIPTSMAIGDERADEWLSEHQKSCPWAVAVRDYRRVNALLKKVESFENGIVDGRYYGGLLYFGATTGRFSGSGGNLNLQNLPRGEMFGVNLRNFISTGPDTKLVVADLSQIEVRTLSWLAQDTETLEEIANTEDIYEAFAIRFGLWNPENGSMRANPALRHKVKQIVLGAGYGCSAKKFALITGMSPQEATESVRLYRRRMPKVVELWESYENTISFALKKQCPLWVELPSGRILNYGKLVVLGGESERPTPAAMLVRNGKRIPVRLWHGLLTENCLAGETEVLTDAGWVCIRDVKPDHRVWDGEEWVHHSGSVSKGQQRVIDCHGVRATPDHKFLTRSGDWVAAQSACKIPLCNLAFPHAKERADYGPHWSDLRKSDYPVPSGNSNSEKWKDANSMESPVPVWEYQCETNRGHQESYRVQPKMPPYSAGDFKGQVDARKVKAQAVRRMEVDARSVPPFFSPIMEELRRAWDYCLRAVAGQLSSILGRHVPVLAGGSALGPYRQQQWLFPRKLSVGNSSRERQQHAPVKGFYGYGRSGKEEWHKEKYGLLPDQAWPDAGASVFNTTECGAEVYDLLNCGPRNRFMVRGACGTHLIAHNCAQALARDIFADMLLRIEEAGWKIILHVHDEVVVEVPTEQAEEAAASITAIMSTPPSWIPDIPLATEAEIIDKYTK